MQVTSPDDALLSRRDRERLARRLAMLDAALAVFGEKGFEGATLDEIAERAEFGKGTLYNYFPGGKDELYRSLFEERVVRGLYEVVERTLPEARSLATRAEAREAFRDFVVGLLEHFDAHRSALRLFMAEGPRAFHDPERMRHVIELFAGFTEAVTRAVERAIEAGALRPLPALPVAHLLIGNVRGVLMAHAATDCAPDHVSSLPELVPAETADLITTVLFDGLLAPASSDAGAPSPDA
ncbi:TetR/AcrR family transcriptional regulator [Rubrivirga marina]|uniref:TetR/AcrR family transcriptional regulator n=1 Tax=Rubrivirga marina TaxID=1196024 RepID=UPI001C52DA92|nr:TetR/AcrR family transcriptional regulator [Rubrivirga marina]